jgi:hypothetical protein
MQCLVGLDRVFAHDRFDAVAMLVVGCDFQGDVAAQFLSYLIFT